MLRFPSLLLSQACLSLLQLAWASGPELPQLVRTTRSSKKPRRPSQRFGKLPSRSSFDLAQQLNCTGSVENLAWSPMSRFATNVVTLSLYPWTPRNLGLLCVFSTEYDLLLCCPKALEPSMSMLTLPVWRAFVLLSSLFSCDNQPGTKVDKRLPNSLWSWGTTSSLCPDRHRLFKLQRVVAYDLGDP